MTDEELTDLIAEAITDSLDMDWNSSDGARAVMDMLWREGLLPLNADEQLMIDRAWETHKAAGPHCSIPPEGWFCTRDAGHIGPCAARICDEVAEGLRTTSIAAQCAKRIRETLP